MACENIFLLQDPRMYGSLARICKQKSLPNDILGQKYSGLLESNPMLQKLCLSLLRTFKRSWDLNDKILMHQRHRNLLLKLKACASEYRLKVQGKLSDEELKDLDSEDMEREENIHLSWHVIQDLIAAHEVSEARRVRIVGMLNRAIDEYDKQVKRC